jgi:hypothetical protein
MKIIPYIAFSVLTITAASFVTAADRAPPQGRHHPDVVSTQIAIETSSEMVLLPSNDNGNLTVNNCANCKAITLAVNKDTAYLIGTDKVSLKDFRHFLMDGLAHYMTVFRAVNEPIALRLVLDAPQGGRAQNR